MKGRWRRVGDVAVPASVQAKRFLEKIEDGKVFSTERNQRQVALFFVLCGIVAENLDTTKERVRNEAMLQAGYVKTWISMDGKEERRERKSITEMSQKEFNRCFQDCVPIMAEWLGVLPDELREEAMLRYNEAVDGDLPERLQSQKG